MNSPQQLQTQIQSTENEIFAAERAEREGYNRLAQLRLDLATSIISQTPFDAEAIDISSVSEQIQSAWPGLLHHRWQTSRAQLFAACEGWVFRAQVADDPSKLELSLEPAQIDGCDELVGMPRRCMPVHNEIANTLSEAAVYCLDSDDLTRALTRLVRRTQDGMARPDQSEKLGVIEDPPSAALLA
jgi:hypothetical protein